MRSRAVFRKSVVFTSFLCLNLLGMGLFYSPFILIDGINSSPYGVHQRVLVITRTGYDGYINNVIDYVENSGLIVDILYTDKTEIHEDVFYNGNNGKYSLIHINFYSEKYIDEIEWHYINSYESKFNITESSVYAPSFNNIERYGVKNSGNHINIENVTFTTNNLRIEFDDPNRGNFTTISEVTLFDNATIYAYAGNTTCNIPFLWSYTDKQGVTRIGCSQYDRFPLYNKMYQYLPFMLSAKISINNILLKAFVTYDIDDINGMGYGRNPDKNESLKMLDFYNNSSMPFNLFFMHIFEEPLYPGYQDLYDVIRSNRDAFKIYLHPSLSVDYKRIEEGMNLLFNENLYVDCLYYFVPGKHDLVSSDVVEYLYETYNIKIIAQATTQLKPSSWFDEYPNTWLFSRPQFSSDVETLENLLTYYNANNYAQWCFMKLLKVPGSCQITGGYIPFWSHYQGFRNEQPMLRALRDIVFDIDIFPIIPVCTEQIAMATRTISINGGYNLTNPIYYSNENKLTFSLINKNTSPDDICGLLLPSDNVKMKNAMMITNNVESSFILFKYKANKQYEIYLNKSEKRIHIINTNAWLSSVIYNDHNISFTVEAPINVTSFTKIYCDQYGKPTQINGSMNWDYDEIMKTLTIQTLHRQHSQTITLTWSEIILNSPPIASFNHSPNEPVVFSPVSFNDSSIDPNGSVVSWQWDFGDGGVSSLKNPVHTYRKDGIYTVSLTVFDDKNEINTNYKDITINNISFVDRNLQRITSIVGILLFVILILYLYARARARRPG